MSLEQIRKHYKVPAKRGGRVSIYGEPGTIRSSHCGRLRVEMDAKPGMTGRRVTCHPVDGVLYIDGGLSCG